MEKDCTGTNGAQWRTALSLDLRGTLDLAHRHRGSIHTAWWSRLQCPLHLCAAQLVSRTATAAVVSAIVFDSSSYRCCLRYRQKVHIRAVMACPLCAMSRPAPPLRHTGRRRRFTPPHLATAARTSAVFPSMPASLGFTSVVRLLAHAH